MDRFARQRLLAAVGEPGQQRIAAASYTLASGSAAASSVLGEYLRRAGAERFSADVAAAAVPPGFAHAAAFRTPAARDFAEGAWRALVQLKAALEDPS